VLPNVFNDGSLFATDSKGGNLTVVHRVVSSRNTFQVQRLDSLGKRTWSRDFPYTPRPIPDAVKDSVVSSQYRSAAKFPAHMPAVSRLVVGEDGTVWLRREELGRNGRSEWNVLDPGGRPVGRFETSKRFQIHVATRQRILAALEDENDAPMVVRFAVAPSR
jgi:hypothetical protein